MKIIFLNTFDAHLPEALEAFFNLHKKDTDIFCLQENHRKAHPIIKKLLDDFAEITASKKFSDRDTFTNSIFVRKTLPVESSGSTTDAKNTGLSQYVTIEVANTKVHIANVHGLAQPGHKLDTPERIQQSQEIIDVFASLSGIKIIGGDFNVLPENECIRAFTKAGYRDLIKEFSIKTTRNEIVWAKYPGNELYYSDYVFVKDAEVSSFEVPKEIVSDHQPMILTVNL